MEWNMIMVNVFNVYYSKIKFYNIIYIHKHHLYACVYVFVFIEYVCMCVYVCIYVFYLDEIPFLPFNSKSNGRSS